MANRTDRPDLDDHDGVGDDVDGAGQGDGSAGNGSSTGRYKQVRRRAGAAPEAETSEGVADTNRMKRARRRSTTSGGTSSTAGQAGSTASDEAGSAPSDGGVAGRANSIKTRAGKAAADKAAAKTAAAKRAAGRTPVTKAAAGRTASGKAPAAQTAAGKSRSSASDATDVEETDSDPTSKAAADIPARKSDVSAKWAVDRLDARERRISFAAAGAALLFGITIYISETHDKTFHLSKNQLTPEWTLILGIAAAALLLGATFLGRRAPVGFVALFAGAMFTGSSIIFGLPFIAVALWILYRSYKVQKEMSASVRAARAESRSQAATSRSGASTRGTAGPARGSAGPARGAKATTKAKGPVIPEGNKRFTPKRPPPPAPKPSRRERKAAQASD
jgi:hypothetical protein